MKVEYTLVLLVISLLFGLLKTYLPDFPISDVAFQAVVLYILVKLGVLIVGMPATALRNAFTTLKVRFLGVSVKKSTK